MQILVLNNYDSWGHAVSKVNKNVLADAMKHAVQEMKSKDVKHDEQQSEVVVYQTLEDLI